MPPSKNEVMAAVERIVARGPKQIYEKYHLSVLIMRELKTSAPYASKMLDELTADGLIKEIDVDPAGYLSLTSEEREGTTLFLIYFHPGPHSEPVFGTLSLKRGDQGHLWKGKRRHAYATTTSAWDALRGELVADVKAEEVRLRKEREDRRFQENAAIEAAAPGYAEALKVLTELLPGIEVQISGLTSGREDPRLWVAVEGLRMSDLKKIVELVQRSSSAS